MKHILTILALVCISQLSWAQLIEFHPGGKNNYWHWSPDKKSDELLLSLDNNEKLAMTYNWFHFEERNRDRLVKDIEHTIEALKNALNDMEFNSELKYHVIIDLKKKYIPDSLRYRTNTKSTIKIKGKPLKPEVYHNLTIKVRDAQKREERFLLKENKMSEKVRWQHIIELQLRSNNLKFYVNEINDLKCLDINYDAFFRQINIKTNELKPYSYFSKSDWTLANKQFQSSGFRWKESRPPYFVIGISPSVGTSLVKGKLSTDVGIMVGALFNHKQNGSARLGLRYQLKNFGKYNGQKSSYAGFIDGILDLNIGQNYKTQKWIGLGIGYLLHENGNIYDSNTGRIFFKFRSSKLWGIQPAYNYSFDTKKGFLSMGLFFSL
jgi:hypothetical protein